MIDQTSFILGHISGYIIVSIIGAIAYIIKNKKTDSVFVKSKKVKKTYSRPERNIDDNHTKEWYLFRKVIIESLEDKDKIIDQYNCTSLEDFIDTLSYYIADNISLSDSKTEYEFSELVKLSNNYIREYLDTNKLISRDITNTIMNNSIAHQFDTHNRPIIIGNNKNKIKTDKDSVDIFKSSNFYDESW